MTEQKQDPFEHWCIVDVMGHQQYAGLVTEANVAGAGFIRIDIPATDEIGAWTKFLGPNAIHSFSIVSEEIATAVANHRAEKPVATYEMTPRITDQAISDDDFMTDNPY